MRAELESLILDKDLVHHALLLRTNNIEELGSELRSVLSAHLGLGAGSPDLLFFSDERLKIDTVRSVRNQQIQKPVSGELRVIILSFTDATGEAQNALLKVLEDPASATRFILITNITTELLPTVLSRVNVLYFSNLGGEQEKDMLKRARLFLSSTFPERLIVVKELLEEPSSYIGAFLESLESLLHSALHNKTVPARMLEDFLEIKGFTRANGASVKMCLETLALTLPKI